MRPPGGVGRSAGPSVPARPEVLLPAPSDAVLAAVLTALAGARRGDRVAAVGTGPRTAAALLAMTGGDRMADGDARVVVAGSAPDVPGAVRLLAPGGRLVAVAADAGAASRVAATHGLVLRHVEPLGGAVAWSAVRPAESPDPA